MPPNLQDVVNAAYRIRQSSEELQERTAITADALGSHGDALAELNRGQSRTAEEAVRQINIARRMTQECAVSLNALKHNVDQFLQHVAE